MGGGRERGCHNFLTRGPKLGEPQIDSSTIDGNVEFVHSQYSCILTSQVSVKFFLYLQTSSITLGDPHIKLYFQIKNVYKKANKGWN